MRTSTATHHTPPPATPSAAGADAWWGPWTLIAVLVGMGITSIGSLGHATEPISLHVAFESATIVFTILVLGTVWNRYALQRHGTAALITCGLMASALFDIGHLARIDPQPGSGHLGFGHGPALHFLMASHMSFAMTLAISAWLPAGFALSSVRRRLVLAGCLLAVSVAVWAITASEGAWMGTYVATSHSGAFDLMLLLAAIAGMTCSAHLAQFTRSPSQRLLLAAVLLALVSELAEFFAASLPAGCLLTSHVARVLAYGLVYRSMYLRAVRQPFEELEAAKRFVESGERYFRKLTEESADAYVVVDRTGTILYHSESCERVFGRLPAVGRSTAWELVDPACRSTLKEAMCPPDSNTERACHVLGLVAGPRKLEAVVRDLSSDPDVAGIVLSFRDVSAAQQAQLQLLSAIRRQRMLSACNSVLLHACDEQQLLADVCDLIVHEGDFPLAWVAYPGANDGVPVNTMAYAGCLEELPAEFVSGIVPGEQHEGPAARAIRTCKVQLSRGLTSDSVDASAWEGVSAFHGLHSGVCLPMWHGDKVIGALCIHDTDDDAFGADDMALLRELAQNLCFGIRTLRAGVERRQALDELRFKNMLLETQQESTLDGILVVDPQGRFVSYNRKFSALWNLPDEVEAVGHDQRIREIVLAKMKRPDEVRAGIKFLYQNPDETGREEIELLDGTLIDRFSSPIKDAAGKLLGRVFHFRDVTEQRRSAERLRESELKYRSIFEHASDVLYTMSTDGRFTSLSPSFRHVTGHVPEEWIGRPYGELICADDLDRVARVFESALTTGESQFVELRILDSRGRTRDVDLTIGPIVLDGQRCLSGIARDMTEQKTQQRRIERLTRFYAMLSGVNGAIARVHDRMQLFDEACRIAVEDGKFQTAWIGLLDEAKERITPVALRGQSCELFRGQSFLVRPEDAAAGSPVAQVIHTLSPRFANELKSGPYLRPVTDYERYGMGSAAALALVVDGQPYGVICLYSSEQNYFDEAEISLLGELTGNVSFALDHIAQEERVNYLAYYDMVTGLPNAAFFSENLDEDLNRLADESRRAAVAVGDIERFRAVKEAYGRVATEHLLNDIALRLRHAARGDVRVARLDADRFAFFLSEAHDGNQAAHFAERLQQSCFSEPFKVAGDELRLSMRMGIALFPNDGRSAESLVKHADVALAKAKSATERVMFYAPDMNAKVAESLALESRLRRAVSRGEFVLHYQPKFDSRSQRLMAVEALIRWNDPEHGLIPPLQFIPLLEQSGMILRVGQWALEEAVAQHQRWHDMGYEAPRIAVNVSAIQLSRRDFVDTVKQALGGRGQHEHGLDIEITESMIMADPEENIDKLQRLRDLGIQVAIDDFGTGYSSLRYIARLPLDTLKIDRSFVVRMPENADDMSIVSTVIALAHDLGLNVVAEGVDSPDQAKLLRLLRCDQLQGFLFSKPVPPEEMETRLVRRVPLPAPAGSQQLAGSAVIPMRVSNDPLCGTVTETSPEVGELPISQVG